MYVGDRYTVPATISGVEAESTLREIIEESRMEGFGEPEIDRIWKEHYVKVTLHDSDKFKIEFIGDEEQNENIKAIVKNRVTKWEWIVEPLEEGKHRLIIHVVPVEFNEATDNYRPICGPNERSICLKEITVLPKPKPFLKKLQDFVKDYWDNLLNIIATILAAVISAALVEHIKRRGKPKPPTPEENGEASVLGHPSAPEFSGPDSSDI